MRLLLDTLIYFSMLLIALLLLTGGVQYISPTLKLELSQIDVFAWVLLALLAIYKMKYQKWLPARLEHSIHHLNRFSAKKPELLLYLGIGLYVVFQTWISIWRFESFQANAFDLSYMDQPIWATTHVGFLYSSLSVQNTYLGEHFSPILGVLGLLYQLWDSVYLLFILHSCLLGFSALIVYRICLEYRLKKPVALLVSICFLIYQPLRAANQFDFREDAFFVPLFLGALLLAKRERWFGFWIICTVSWTVKENASIFTALLGIWLFMQSRVLHSRIHKGQGIVLFLISGAVFFIVNSYLTPYFSGDTEHTRFVFRMRGFGDSLGEFLMFMVSQPLRFLQEMSKVYFQKDSLRYALKVLTPFLFFIPKAPIAIGIGIIGLLLNIMIGIIGVGFHYECILLPFLFLGLITGLSKLKSTRSSATLFLVFLSFLLFYGRSPIHSIRHYYPNEHHRLIASELKQIPPEASIATISAIHPHLTHRKHAFLIPAPKDVDYIIADTSADLSQYGTPNLLDHIEAIKQNPKYQNIVDQDGLLIWKKQTPLEMIKK